MATPIYLPAGFHGTIEADGYGPIERNGNMGEGVLPLSTDGGTGAISFVDGGRFGAAGSFPTSLDSGPANRYAAGTFVYSASPAGTPVATFTDPGGANAANLSHYSVSINWGDNTAPSAGFVTLTGNTFTAWGNHSYTAPGTYTVTTTITHDGHSTTTTSTATVSTIALNPTSLPSGTAGQFYSQPLVGSAAATPLTYSVVSGSLPLGLGLNSSTGVLSGYPAAGTYNFTVQVRDSANGTGLADLWSGQGNGNDGAGGNPGTLVNGVSFATGQVGQAFSFNGNSNQYVQLPNNVVPFPASGTGNTPFSFQTWFQTSSGGVILGQQGFAPFANKSGWIPQIYVDTSGFLRVQMVYPALPIRLSAPQR